MEWNYKTDPDFKWPKPNEKVLLADFNGATWVSFFDDAYVDIVEAWAKIEPPKKQRWRPGYGDYYWFISNLDGCFSYVWTDEQNDSNRRDVFGAYKTKEEAGVMLQKIKDFVTKEIGEP